MMDAKIARYIDGDLTDQEAEAFLEAIENDPALEKELRDYERLLLIGSKLSPPRVPSGFTDRVMARVTDSIRPQEYQSTGEKRIKQDRPARPGLFGFRWPGFALVLASVALAYFGGWWFGHNVNGPTAPPGEVPGLTSSTGTVASTGAASTAAAGELHYVRLVYVPSQVTVEQVHVAGSFNGWDSEATPLRRQNGVWSTMLVLAPGSYEYMFVEDGTRWVTDPLAARTRDDGFGGTNAILDVEI